MNCCTYIITLLSYLFFTFVISIYEFTKKSKDRVTTPQILKKNLEDAKIPFEKKVDVSKACNAAFTKATEYAKVAFFKNINSERKQVAIITKLHKEFYADSDERIKFVIQNPEDMATKDKFISYYNDHQKDLLKRAKDGESIIDSMWFCDFFMQWEKAYWDVLESLKEKKSVDV